MCTSHQPGSVTRFHMAIVAIMVLLLFVTAVITGTCSLSSEGNMVRHTAPPHTVSQTSMPGCLPGCPMHHSPCPATQHHGTSACAFCTPPEPSTIATTALPTGTFPLAAVTHPGLPSLVPPVTLSASSAPPPLDPPRATRPASLRV